MIEYEKIDELTDGLKAYANTSFELVKLEVTKQSSELGASFVSGLLVGILFIFFLSFSSIAASLYLSSILGYSYSGFLIVAGFYLLIGCILLIGRKQLLERPIRDKIVQKVFSKD